MFGRRLPESGWEFRTGQRQAGAILLFSGKTPLSILIEWLTGSRFSHLAGVARISTTDLQVQSQRRRWKPTDGLISSWRHLWHVVEATTLNGDPCEILGKRVKGVQVQDLNRRVECGCPVWVMRPVVAFNECESQRLTAFLLNRVGEPYSDFCAVLSATRWLKRWWPSAHSLGRLFCSKLWIEAIMYALEGRRIPDWTAGEMNPADAVRELVGSGLYLAPEPVI